VYVICACLVFLSVGDLLVKKKIPPFRSQYHVIITVSHNLHIISAVTSIEYFDTQALYEIYFIVYIKV
jgi:hypothetical protein